MTGYDILYGSGRLTASEVGHVIVPGRGRNSTGTGLSEMSIKRTNCAADFFLDMDLEYCGGVIVPSGYKTPADKNGKPWYPPGDASEVFSGVPEADSMSAILLKRGIGATAISIERHSFNTITNFVYAESEGHFPDDKPVAIVSQEQHLERIIKHIAPKTLKREYLGVVVPETKTPDQDTVLSRAASFISLVGIQPNSKDIVEKTSSRGRKIWSVVNFLRPS